MAAEQFGRLVTSIEADNSKLKKSLAQSEHITAASGAKMQKSLDRVSGSSDKTTASFQLLEKAAAATGLTWLTQLKSLGEFALALGGLKAAIGTTTAATTVQTVAVTANTRAWNANAAAVGRAVLIRRLSGGGGSGSRLLGTAAAGAAGGGLVTAAKSGLPTFAKVGRIAAGAAGLLAKGLAALATAGGAAVVAVAALVAVLGHHWLAQRKLNAALKEGNERNDDLLKKFRDIKRAEAKRVSDLNRASEAANRGLTGFDLELFNAGAIRQQAVKLATIANIEARREQANRATADAMAKQSRELAKQQAAAAKLAAFDTNLSRIRQRGASRAENAALSDPSLQFESALQGINQQGVKRDTILRGALQALNQGASAQSVKAVLQSLGISPTQASASRAAGSTSVSEVGFGLLGTGGGLGNASPEIRELKKQTTIGQDSKTLLREIRDGLRNTGGLQ